MRRGVKAELTGDYLLLQPCIKDSNDRFQHFVHVIEHATVGKPCNRPALHIHEFVAPPVIGTACMLAAVQFYDEIGFAAGEVCVVSADRELADEFEAVQPAVSKFAP